MRTRRRRNNGFARATGLTTRAASPGASFNLSFPKRKRGIGLGCIIPFVFMCVVCVFLFILGAWTAVGWVGYKVFDSPTVQQSLGYEEAPQETEAKAD